MWGNILKFGMLALCLSAILPFIRIGSTTLWWLIKSLIILSMFMLWDKSFHPMQIMTWIILVIVSCIVGTSYCEDYWGWKQLVNNVLNYSICIAAFVVCAQDSLQKVLCFLYKHIWKLFIVLALFLTSKAIAKFLLPFTFLALFYPLLTAKYRKYVWLAFGITFVFGYQSRSDLVRFAVCFTIGLWSMRHEVVGLARKFFWIFFVLPVILFALAANGTFNIFKIGESLNSEENTGRISTADTRTILYEEVINTAYDRNTIWLGNTPARGYYSEWMIHNDDQSEVMGDSHYGERNGTESSVLNVFLHFGMFGMVIYLILFVSAAYLGIYKSNNSYLPIIGLYIAFRYTMGWVEDFIIVDVNMFLLWVMIGMCYSTYFREMTDDEFENWFKGILA